MGRADGRSGGGEPLTRALTVAASALALTVSACNLAPTYVTPPMTVPTAFKETGAWSEAAPQDSASRGPWWAQFQDVILSGLEDRIDTANPNLAAALAAYDQSRAFAAEARSNLVPTVTGLQGDSYNRQSDERPLRGAGQPNEYANNTLGGQITYEFDFWGHVRNFASAAASQAQATAADLQTARLSLHVELANDYLQLRGLDAQSALLINTVAAYQRAFNLVQARHLGGVASGLDVDRAGAQLSGAKAQVSDIAAQRALFEHAIASLVGEAASNFTIAPAEADRVIPKTPTGVASTLVQRRPDIAAAERRAFAANRQIGVARAAYFPTFSLNAQYGFQNVGGDDLLIAPNTFWTIGPQLALTLFDGGQRKAAVAASKAAFLQASANYRAAVLLAFQQVEDQLALSNRFATEAADEGAAVTSAQATTRLSLIRYREGATNYLDVVIAQTAELQAEQTAVGLETRRQVASVNLVRALGGGWTTADLPKIGGVASTHIRSSLP